MKLTLAEIVESLSGEQTRTLLAITTEHEPAKNMLKLGRDGAVLYIADERLWTVFRDGSAISGKAPL